MRKISRLLRAVLPRAYWDFSLFHRTDSPPEVASQSRAVT